MNVSQKGFIAPLFLALIALLLIGGGVYVYVQNKQANQNVVVKNDCADFDVFSQFILKNIQKPDSLKTYANGNGVTASYGGYQASGTPARNDLAAMSAIKEASNSLNQNLDTEAIRLGLSTDAPGTVPFQSFNLPASNVDGPGGTNPFIKDWRYTQTFGFRKDNSLYKVTLESQQGLHAYGTYEVSITCEQSVSVK